MTWIAPEVARIETPPIADERTMLDAWLDRHRQTLLMKCTGLTGEQLCLRSAEPSTLSLLGLVRHMAEVERGWFRGFPQGGIETLYCPQESPDGDFDDTDPANAEQDFATFEAEVELARQAAAQHDLDATWPHKRRGALSMRWVMVHMIEEYARHNGHADILRERIDGITGD